MPCLANNEHVVLSQVGALYDWQAVDEGGHLSVLTISMT
jgi:hypothetical protein